MFNITKIREYNTLQIISTIIVNIFALFVIVDIRTTQKYLFFNFETILTLVILICIKSLYEGKGRFTVARTGESNYFEGNKSKIVSFLMLLSVTFMYVMFATFNKAFSDNLILSNLLSTLAGILLFLPFMHYDQESDIQDIHTLETTYLGRGEAIFYRIFLYLVSIIIGSFVSIFISIGIENFIHLNQNSSRICFFLFFIIWMLITSRMINKLTIAGK